MFCKHCGNQLDNDASFCPNCGKVIGNGSYEEPAYTNPAPAYKAVVDEQKERLGGAVLKNAILGMAFACTFFFSWLGLIFSIKSRSNLTTYLNIYGKTDGRATVGKHLGKAALIVSIVMLAILVFYIFLIILTTLGISDVINDNGIYF